MTEQEFDKLECTNPSFYGWKCKTIPNLFRCIKVNYKDDEPTNIGGYTHYMLDDKVYKSKQKLLEAMNDENRGTSTEH